MGIGVMNIFTKPPFELLQMHLNKVIEGVGLMRETVIAYCDDDFKKAEELAVKVVIKEREADEIKNLIREHLPRSLFMPVSRGDFLNYLREQDHIIDRAEDVALALMLRDIYMPQCIKDSIKNLTNNVVEVVELVPETLNSMIELINSSFLKRKEEKVHENIAKLDKREDITAHLEVEVMKCLFEEEEVFSFGEFYVLVDVVKQLAKMADHAENCGDRIRCMIAKRL